jgi:hypothetical protein
MIVLNDDVIKRSVYDKLHQYLKGDTDSLDIDKIVEAIKDFLKTWLTNF